MPFRLCNALGIFQTYINKTLRDILNNFYTAYLDNILIYSKNKEDYNYYVNIILKRLAKANLYVDINKYKFSIKKVKYLGLIISIDSIKIDLDKVKAILLQTLLKYIKNIQSFIGFTNFYQ